MVEMVKQIKDQDHEGLKTKKLDNKCKGTWIDRQCNIYWKKSTKEKSK